MYIYILYIYNILLDESKRCENCHLLTSLWFQLVLLRLMVTLQFLSIQSRRICGLIEWDHGTGHAEGALCSKIEMRARSFNRLL